MSDADKPGRSGRTRKDLLDDLEHLRDLLGESDPDGAEIPILHEVVAEPPRIGVETGSPVPLAEPYAEEQGDLFDPDAFADRLLDEDWAAERERVIEEARRNIGALDSGVDRPARMPLEQILRSALTDRLAPRMEQVLGEAVDQLRDQLLRVVRRELDAIVQDVLSRDPDNRKN